MIKKNIFKSIKNKVIYIYNLYLDKVLQKTAKNFFYKNYNIQFPASMEFGYVDYVDLNNLILMIKKYKPKIVLELGSGYSTYAIIYALLEVHKDDDFKFFSVDQSEEYQNNLKKDFPKDWARRINFLHRKIYLDVFKGQIMSFFEDLPEEKYDYIYEDRMDHPDAKIAGDIIKYETNNLDIYSNFCFTIDGMISTRDYYVKNLTHKYKFDLNQKSGVNFIKNDK